METKPNPPGLPTITVEQALMNVRNVCHLYKTTRDEHITLDVSMSVLANACTTAEQLQIRVDALTEENKTLTAETEARTDTSPEVEIQP